MAELFRKLPFKKGAIIWSCDIRSYCRVVDIRFGFIIVKPYSGLIEQKHLYTTQNIRTVDDKEIKSLIKDCLDYFYKYR